MPTIVTKLERDYTKKTQTAPNFEKQAFNQNSWSEQLETIRTGTRTTTYGTSDLNFGEVLDVLNDFENGGACIKIYQVIFNPVQNSYDLLFTTHSKTQI
jgi:hypothetical protein